MKIWHVRSGSIDEVVRAEDQFEAWNALRDRSADDFGLIVSAEPDESGDPVLARTSALMFSWGRDEDARAFIAAAKKQGLPDTTEADLTFGAARNDAREGGRMRKWLVLASYNENGEREERLASDPDTLERVTAFTSGDGVAPMDGDVAQALDGFSEGEYLLVPVDAAHRVKLSVKTTVDVQVVQELAAQ